MLLPSRHGDLSRLCLLCCHKCVLAVLLVLAVSCCFEQVIRLRKKLSGAADAVKGLFGVGKGNDEVVEKLEKMQVGRAVTCCALHCTHAVLCCAVISCVGHHSRLCTFLLHCSSPSCLLHDDAINWSAFKACAHAVQGCFTGTPNPSLLTPSLHLVVLLSPAVTPSLLSAGVHSRHVLAVQGRVTDTPHHSLLTPSPLWLYFFLPPCCLQERIRGVRTLFRDASQTEFIIATIPTQLGIAESRRLLAALQEETIPCKRVIVNQVCVRVCMCVFLGGGLSCLWLGRGLCWQHGRSSQFLAGLSFSTRSVFMCVCVCRRGG